jgi:hypothetical protein
MLGEAKTQVRKEELRKQRLYPTDGITEFFNEFFSIVLNITDNA